MMLDLQADLPAALRLQASVLRISVQPLALKHECQTIGVSRVQCKKRAEQQTMLAASSALSMNHQDGAHRIDQSGEAMRSRVQTVDLSDCLKVISKYVLGV